MSSRIFASAFRNSARALARQATPARTLTTVAKRMSVKPIAVSFEF
jgi:hypothetical protein